MVTGGGNVGVVAGTVSLPGSPSSCLQTVGTVSTAATVASETSTAVLPARRTSENRRSNKPIMEKRRRARINNCLNELKTLILDAMKKDPARHSKLEKADILEMTVKHLETLQRQQVAMSAATDPSVVNKFRAGFSECAGEVGRFPGLDSPVRRRLLQHLSNCINGSTTTTPESQTPPTVTTTTQHAVQVHILPSPSSEGHPTQTTSANGIFFSTGGTGGGLQLVPTRLPNGDIALVLPAASSGTQIFRQTVASSPASSPAPSTSSSSSTSPLPMLVTTSSPLPMLIPIPSRTSSSGSASSSSVSSSSCTSTSPVAFDRLSVQSPPADHRPVYSPPLQKPLALVMRKTCPERQCEEEKPWRPW